MARIGEYRDNGGLVEARTRFLESLKDDDAKKNEARFMGRLEKLIEAIIADQTDRRY